MSIRTHAHQLVFEQVVPTDEQLVTLYELLKIRKHTISHFSIPSHSEHTQFVNNHPYRAWFLVKLNRKCIGSFYIASDNTVGINVSEEYLSQQVKNIFNFVQTNYQPLAAIPSVRSEKFAINVPTSNKVLAEALEDLGAKIEQVTYYLPIESVTF